MYFIVQVIGGMVLLYHLNHCFYCDYFYQNSGTRYAFRGGRCNSGFYCGFAFISLDLLFYGAYWYIGAALSFKTSLLFYF